LLQLSNHCVKGWNQCLRKPVRSMRRRSRTSAGELPPRSEELLLLPHPRPGRSAEPKSVASTRGTFDNPSGSVGAHAEPHPRPLIQRASFAHAGRSTSEPQPRPHIQRASFAHAGRSTSEPHPGPRIQRASFAHAGRSTSEPQPRPHIQRASFAHAGRSTSEPRPRPRIERARFAHAGRSNHIPQSHTGIRREHRFVASPRPVPCAPKQRGSQNSRGRSPTPRPVDGSSTGAPGRSPPRLTAEQKGKGKAQPKRPDSPLRMGGNSAAQQATGGRTQAARPQTTGRSGPATSPERSPQRRNSSPDLVPSAGRMGDPARLRPNPASGRATQITGGSMDAVRQHPSIGQRPSAGTNRMTDRQTRVARDTQRAQGDARRVEPAGLTSPRSARQTAREYDRTAARTPSPSASRRGSVDSTAQRPTYPPTQSRPSVGGNMAERMAAASSRPPSRVGTPDLRAMEEGRSRPTRTQTMPGTYPGFGNSTGSLASSGPQGTGGISGGRAAVAGIGLAGAAFVTLGPTIAGAVLTSKGKG